MNPLLLLFTLFSVLNSVVIGAPAVSSVHVSFVSGNKATQYSHGSLPDGSVQYNVVGDMGGHTVKKRSTLTRRPPREPGRRLIPRTTTTTTESSTFSETESPDSPLPTTDVTFETTKLKPGDSRRIKSGFRLKERKRVEFIVPETTGRTTTDEEKRKFTIVASVPTSASTTTVLLTSTTTTDKSDPLSTDDTNIVKPKDSKAVKRSPYVSENFVGAFNFPDFDEFGGNDFGSLNNFGHSNSGPSHSPAHGTMNAESLAPEGVFLPPIPTQASNYIENDPYLADAEVAKYASQHPPYFHEFPHKRTVLSLNERREENGLEPNILRSIRPFFAFFEINNHGSIDSPFLSSRVSHHHYPPFPFDLSEPSVLLYSEQLLLPKVTIQEPWNLFSIKK